MLTARQKRTFIGVIVGMIIVVFIFWGTGTYTSRGGNIIAKINGTVITRSEYQKELVRRIEAIERQTGQSISGELLNSLRVYDQVLNQMINTVLMKQTAKRLGITVANSELQFAIAESPFFQDPQRHFSLQLYKNSLARIRMTPPEYEEEVKNQLLINKLLQFVSGAVAVSEQEARNHFLLEQEKISLETVKIDSADLVDKLPISKAEIEDYNKVHAAGIKNYYESHISEFNKPEQVKARHILVEISTTGPKEAEERKAKETLDKIRQTTTPQNFAELAKKNSHDSTAKMGGDLGWFSRDTMVKEFSDVAFSQKPGTISAVFKSPFGYHIVFVEDKRAPIEHPLEQAAPEIAAKLIKENRADEKTKELSLQVLDAWKSSKPIAPLLAQYNIKPVTTGLFSQSAPSVPKIGQSPELIEEAFALSKENPFPREPIFVNNSWVVFKLQERISADESKFNQEKEKIIKDITQEKSSDALQQFYASIRTDAKIIRTKAALDQTAN